MSPPWDTLAAEAELAVTVKVVVRREPDRGPCFECRRRRVLHRIGVFTFAGPTGITEARCRQCWGFALSPPDSARTLSASEQK